MTLQNLIFVMFSFSFLHLFSLYMLQTHNLYSVLALHVWDLHMTCMSSTHTDDYTCPILVCFLCHDKKRNKNDPGRQRFIVTYRSQLILKEPRQELGVRTWNPELKQKSWRNAAYWLSQLVFFYTPKSPAQSGGPVHSGLSSPQQSLIKKIPHKLASRPICCS